MFPLNPTVILQGFPNDLVRFLNGPLYNVENQIVPSTPNGPRETTTHTIDNPASTQYMEFFEPDSRKLWKFCTHNNYYRNTPTYITSR